MVASLTMKKPAFDGQRNLEALAAGLAKATGEEGFSGPVVGDLSMFYFGLVTGKRLLDQLTKFEGTSEEAWHLLYALELHVDDLRADAEKLVRKLVRLRSSVHARVMREKRARKKHA